MRIDMLANGPTRGVHLAHLRVHRRRPLTLSTVFARTLCMIVFLGGAWAFPQYFSPPMNISNNGNSMLPVVAADPIRGYVYIVSCGAPTELGGSEGLWFMRSTDGGGTFSAPANIGSGFEPSMTVDTVGAVWIVWSEQVDIVVKRSLDGGVTFSTVGSPPLEDVGSAPFIARRNPDISVGPEGIVTVVWQSLIAEGNADVFVSRSYDGGGTFSYPVNVSGDPAYSSEPRVAAGLDGSIHIVWGDPNSGAIQYVRSVSGSVFGSPLVIVGANYGSRRPRIATGAAGAITAVSEGSFFVHSTDNGNSFTQPQRIVGLGDQHPDTTTEPDGTIDVVAQGSGAGGSVKLTFARTKDGGSSFSNITLARVTGDVAMPNGGIYETGLPRISTGPTGIHVVWYDFTTRAFDTFYTRGMLAKFGGPFVTLSSPSLSFPSQSVGSSSTPQSVTVTNTGNAALAISGITASGDFNQSNSCGTGLLAGSSCSIYVSFAPTAVGTRTGELTITDNAPGGPHIVLLSGTGVSTTGGTPIVSLSALSLYFGNPVVGTTIGPLTVTLANTGDGSLQILDCSITGANSGDFGFSGCAAGTYSPGAALPIAVTFTPTAVGGRTATLSVNDNAPGTPHKVSLNGFGMAPFHQFDQLNVPQPTYDSSAKCVTQYYGCALTATGSLLTTFNSSVTPSSLDQFLSQPAINGYSDCGLLFATVPQLPALGNAVQLLPNWDPGTQDLNTYLAVHLSAQQQRVILQLCEVASDGSCAKDSKGDLKTHYIVATGPISSTDWQVFDPGWNDVTAQPNLTTLSGHTDGFSTSGGFHKYKVIGTRTFAGAADPSAFSAQAQSPVELLVTDPQGRRLGNPGTGNDLFEIPLGSYMRDFPLASDDGSGPSLGDPTGLKTAYVPSPEDGTYTVVATGTGSGSYTLDVQAVASDGTVQPASVSGVTAPGSTATYEVTYSSAPGSPPSVTRQPTGPIASLSTAAASFGSQLVGTTSAAQTVTLTNTGDPELTIVSISVLGDFVLGSGSTCGAQVAASASCTINIAFKPTATGNRTGTLTIDDNAPGRPHTVALSGTGTDFTVAAASGSLTDQTVAAGGSPVIYNLTITPNGLNGTATLSCAWVGTQPSGTACAVLPTSVTLSGSTAQSATVTVTTTKRSMVGPSLRLPPPGVGSRLMVPWFLWLAGLGMLTLLAAASRGSERVWLRRATPFGALLFLILLWSACGGGGGGGGGGGTTPQPTGTPVGTYYLTVTATAGGASRPITLTLHVT